MYYTIPHACIVYATVLDNVRPRGVLMMLILLLQATTFIQSSLLLRCGDIESNPGPGIYPGIVCIDRVLNIHWN